MLLNIIGHRKISRFNLYKNTSVKPVGRNNQLSGVVFMLKMRRICADIQSLKLFLVSFRYQRVFSSRRTAY